MNANMNTSALGPARTWSVVAIALAAAPTLLVGLAWLTGELPERHAWFAQSNHGPWRSKPSGLLLHGAISAVRARQPLIILPFVATAALSAALLHVVLSQFFWLID